MTEDKINGTEAEIKNLPRRTDKPLELVDLTGMFCAFFEGQPVFLHFGGSNDLYVLCASDEDVLREFTGKAKAKFDSIKRITNGREFLDSFPLKLGDRTVRFAVNPYEVDNGRIRWLEVQR